jgi:hypothetical protein
MKEPRLDAVKLGEAVIQERCSPIEAGQVEFILAEGIPLPTLSREERLELLTKVAMVLALTSSGQHFTDLQPRSISRYRANWREGADENTSLE